MQRHVMDVAEAELVDAMVQSVASHLPRLFSSRRKGVSEVIELNLPYPPSINHYFSYYQGRPVLSKDARAYRHQVRRIAIARGIKPLLGKLAVRIDIAPPDDRRRDCDNVQKAVLDALQHAGVFWDDSQIVWLLSIKCEPQVAGFVKVKLDDFSNRTTSTLTESSEPCRQICLPTDATKLTNQR